MTRRQPDWAILGCVLTLLFIGLLMVGSSSSVRALGTLNDPFYYLKRQALWSIIGLGVMAWTIRLDYQVIRKYARVFFLLTLVAIIAVLIPGIGQVAGGARRWIVLGPLRFQPSELMKLAIVVYVAWALSRVPERVRDFTRGILPYVILVGVVFLLILQQPDLGTATAVAGTVVLMLFSAGARLGHLALLGLAALPVGVYAVVGQEYRLSRWEAYINPFADPQGSGFHIIQALYALGSGGLFGLGLGNSRQKFFYLPAEHTDFIFAILGEEIGFVGAVFVISLFLLLAWRGYNTAARAPDNFSSLLAAGITTMIVLQAMLNIGVVCGLLPITGVPLPLVSFGGSSLVPTLAGVGLLLNISRHRGLA
jgi:cell division protein FtsW